MFRIWWEHNIQPTSTHPFPIWRINSALPSDVLLWFQCNSAGDAFDCWDMQWRNDERYFNLVHANSDRRFYWLSNKFILSYSSKHSINQINCCFGLKLMGFSVTFTAVMLDYSRGLWPGIRDAVSWRFVSCCRLTWAMQFLTCWLESLMCDKMVEKLIKFSLFRRNVLKFSMDMTVFATCWMFQHAHHSLWLCISRISGLFIINWILITCTTYVWNLLGNNCVADVVMHGRPQIPWTSAT